MLHQKWGVVTLDRKQRTDALPRITHIQRCESGFGNLSQFLLAPLGNLKTPDATVEVRLCPHRFKCFCVHGDQQDWDGWNQALNGPRQSRPNARRNVVEIINDNRQLENIQRLCRYILFGSLP